MFRRTFLVRLLSGLGAILILATGCSDLTPTNPQLDTTYRRVALPTAERGPSFSLSGTAGGVIGPEGGSIQAGRVTITFPAGALAEPTEITVTPDADYLAVVLGPHGIQFPAGHEPTLTFSYEGIDGLPEQDLTIYYLSDSGVVLEQMRATVDLSTRSVTARLGHFSEYAVIAQ